MPAELRVSNQAPAWEQLHALGFRYQLLGEWEHSRQYYEEALDRKPDYAPAQMALAQLRMVETCFREGRDLYEARFAAREESGGFDWRQLPSPRWKGEKLKGKHLHLWAEQGFGDVILYASFLPHLLAQQPERITLSMFPKMMTLFARSFPQVSVEPLQDIASHALSSSILDTFPRLLALAQQTGISLDLEPMRKDYERALQQGATDYAAPMGDLMVYGLPDIIPAQRQAHYLTADARRVAATQESLQHLGKGRRIGISWHTANPESGGIRSIAAEHWRPVFNAPHCHFIALQHHVSPADTEHFRTMSGCRLLVDPAFDPAQDTEGLAALVACMDEVITIDNSNAHLAGALGVPTTLLLPKGCDFRWPVLEDERDTLWYGSVRAERQERALDWTPVMERVAAGLRRRCA